MGSTILWQCLCSFFGILLLSSAWAKFRSGKEFREIAAGYRLARWPPARLWAPAVTPFEGLLAAGHLSLNRYLATCSLFGTLAFIGVATWGVAGRWRRGEGRVPCGCGPHPRGGGGASTPLFPQSGFVFFFLGCIVIMPVLEKGNR